MFLCINASPSPRVSISFQQMNSLEVCSSKIIYIYPIFNIDLQFQSVSHLKISATCVLNVSLKTVIKTDVDAYCNVWNETNARRGYCEIASCVFSYLKTLFKENIKSVITDFDYCSVQNKNRSFKAIVWLSAHSCKRKKNISLFITPELARSPNPYKVTEITFLISIIK